MPSTSKDKICCIVDAYSAGALLAPEFAKRGVRAIHVQSRPDLHEIYLNKFSKDDFIANIIFDGDLDKLVARLRELDLSFLLAGSEIGVSLADQLRHCLNLFPNDISLTRARRNKFEMIEQLRRSGLNAVAQLKSTDVAEVLNWIKLKNVWPVVLKPLECAGTEGVRICSNEDEVRDAFKNIIGKVNHMGILNDAVLVQGFLDGEEYIVNTVSWEGRNVFGDMWHVAKKHVPGAGRIYDYSELLDPEGEPQNTIAEYVFKVIDALKISYGPAHNEVMLTKDGPFLIETGARVDGYNVYANEKYVRCIDAHHVELTAEAYVTPEIFLKRFGRANRIHKPALEVYLMSNVTGTLKEYSNLKEIESLKSFWEMHLRVKPGDRIERTVDLMTLPGHIWLAHDDRDLLFEDYRKIRKIEEGGFYVLK